ncbi:catalase/peroxidase HPI [Pseudoalteromonas rubra]|uniref:Catalase-peroxidase n=1 Tax=Pseudoalteromonas rubra TaxID=43658 RepID=A0A5S3WGJ5_9GAMM|nr:catalase/peroxidase HPI [Pseudoalteromonas rubra]TMP24649.1 catalase/peroxidase HPI [Pseudoalteromonas rubra]TMP36278.1 catalase/peroxidase HPI [Pseudoalteromonas rubra]
MTTKIFQKSALAALVSLAVTGLSACASNDDLQQGSQSNGEISKPKGAVGSGTVPMGVAKSNQFWWPDQLDLSPLRDHDGRSNPLGEDFDYAMAFNQLDMAALKQDMNELLTTSQDWWPADWGNYGPLFIRLAWHSSGTYRTLDGRGGGDGGQMRFDPLNSWPDNGNLDKAKRLLWPLKQKYGEQISWGDLMILAGTVGLENMGFKTYGFAGGRTDDWEPDLVYWGPEVEMLASDREEKDGKLQRPLGATHMGLIYVNPEGPKGKPDPVGSAKNIRVAFGRMAMNDEETVALIAGGHTFGKMHGARKASKCVGKEPGGAAIEEQGLGWKNNCGKGHSEDTVTSGLEGAWTQAPTRWTTLYLQNLLNFEWQQTRSPGGAIQWIPTDEALHTSVPDAHVKGKFNSPVMTTADLALKYDPEYRKIAERFLANPEEYRLAFAKAWYKLTHRDMGPRTRYLGNTAPDEALIWQDPVPAVDHALINESDARAIKLDILQTGISVPALIRTAWASAASFRASDMRGGANGARIMLAPQKDWPVNNPDELSSVLNQLQAVQARFNRAAGGTKQVSMADVIVLAGAAAVEQAAKNAGITVSVPFTPGRTDATQAQTDVESFALLEPKADAFRNYFDVNASYRSPTEMLVDKADQLNLTVPEMTVLLGGLRVLGANAMDSQHGVFTDKVGTLNNDFFVNLLSMSHQWQKTSQAGLYESIDRSTGKKRFTATSVDLIFGSNSELRAVAEVYAYDNAQQKFAEDFVKAWHKVMQLDRFDLRH